MERMFEACWEVPVLPDELKGILKVAAMTLSQANPEEVICMRPGVGSALRIIKAGELVQEMHMLSAGLPDDWDLFRNSTLGFDIYSHIYSHLDWIRRSIDPGQVRPVAPAIATIAEAFNGLQWRWDEIGEIPLLWQVREASRLSRGDYDAVPWANELRPIKDHFVHMSTDENGLVAFTENGNKGKRDIQTRMKPGRYLQKFYPCLSADKIQQWTSKIIGDRTIHYAKTAEEIVTAYVNGPSSCMSHAPSRWSGLNQRHPTEVYGDSDLQLAYLKDGSRVTARCLVWPEKKIYGRCYGDTRLLSLLQNAGYGEGSFRGARVRRIPVSYGYLMPYIDPPTRWVSTRPDDKYHFLLTEGEGNETFEGGYINPGSKRSQQDEMCADCEDYEADINILGVRMTGHTYVIRRVCDSCSHDYFYCEHHGECFEISVPTLEIYFRRDATTITIADTAASRNHHLPYTCLGEACLVSNLDGNTPVVVNGLTYSTHWIEDAAIWVNGELLPRDEVEVPQLLLVGTPFPIEELGQGVAA